MKKKKNIHYFSTVTLIAFAINVLLPFFAIYNLQQAIASEEKKLSPVQELTSLFTDKILICTEGGFKWISLVDLQNSTKTPQPHPQYKCPLCYVSVNGLKYTLLGNRVNFTLFSNPTPLAYMFLISKNVRSRLWLHNHPSHAPPLSIIA